MLLVVVSLVDVMTCDCEACRYYYNNYYSYQLAGQELPMVIKLTII